MNIRQLEAFRAIMVARSTIGAAELLNLSQPAVSRLLSQLEASLKLTLFDRSSGRLVPTPEALLRSVVIPPALRLTASWIWRGRRLNTAQTGMIQTIP